MSHQPIEELDVFQLYEEISDWAWEQVVKWSPLASRTIGEQLIRAIDSVNANLVEGDGRYSAADALRFFIIARGSAREARLWIRRAAKRSLVDAECAEAQIEKLVRATKLLNLLISYRRENKTGSVRESRATYLYATNLDPSRLESPDPFQGDEEACSPQHRNTAIP